MSELQPDFTKMTIDQFQTWKAAHAPNFAGAKVEPLPAPEPAPASDPYAPSVWGSNEYDFTCPSGQTCRMRKIPVEKIVSSGVLDKITRLPAVAQEQIDRAEGMPPKKVADAMPKPEEMEALLDTLNILLPMVVVKPEIYSAPEEGQERVVGRIYVDSIELEDRIAIMERAVGGVRNLEAFRKPA